MAFGDRAAFSGAAMDSGLLERSEVCEFGRRCQDRGEFREGIALEGEEGLMRSVRWRSEAGVRSSERSGRV